MALFVKINYFVIKNLEDNAKHLFMDAETIFKTSGIQRSANCESVERELKKISCKLMEIAVL